MLYEEFVGDGVVEGYVAGWRLGGGVRGGGF